MIESFTNLYSLSKTLRFRLIPVGKTQDWFDQKNMLESDKKRMLDFQVAKKVLDKYHKRFIEEALSTGNIISPAELQAYEVLYFSAKRGEDDIKNMEKIEEKMRKIISYAFVKKDSFSTLFSKEILSIVMRDFELTESEVDALRSFEQFYTYFSGYNLNRKNIYSSEEKSTAVAYRCINENLPRFLDNIKTTEKIFSAISEDDKAQLDTDFSLSSGISFKDYFKRDFFNLVLTEAGIEAYNNVLGGYSLQDGTKVKGINEYVNLYNQIHKDNRLPFLKRLNKQILSDKDTYSYKAETFESDFEALEAVNCYFSNSEKYSISSAITRAEGIEEVFRGLKDYNWSLIYVRAAQIPVVSELLAESWFAFREKWNSEYDEENKTRERNEKYYDKRDSTYRSHKSFSLESVCEVLNLSQETASQMLFDRVRALCSDVANGIDNAKHLFQNAAESRFSKDETKISLIKDLLDSVKALEDFLRIFLGTGKEDEKDELFYGTFLIWYAVVCQIDELYNCVRNYVTRKPYSTDKIKLNFENPQFLGGWQSGKERDYSGSLLRKDNKYFLLICDPKDRSVFGDIAACESGDCEQMIYNQMADPGKDIQNLMVINGKTEKKNGRKDKVTGENKVLEELKNQYLPANINRIRKQKSYSRTSETFSQEDLCSFIDYYAARVKEYYSEFEFHFNKAKDYYSFKDFTDHVSAQAYQVRFRMISMSQISQFVDEGRAFLFELYNKDFSPYSHKDGAKNLHTLYFTMLFDPANLGNIVYKLNGQAELFYRPASILPENQIIHKAGDILKNKNPDNKSKTSQFSYDIIKDRRYTQNQFELHLPITMNFTSANKYDVNLRVREQLKNHKEPYFIGIDRGERHLLYLCVVNSKGEIVEQQSLNTIINQCRGADHKVDYHKLLDVREQERDKSRKAWKSIESIKELKEGYLSLVIRTICDLVIKYDAIVVLEDLNQGFKNSRIKVEKQVYQKFEKMLIDKLSFLVSSKTAPSNSIGGLLHAYQLTSPFESFSKLGKQSGVIFYVPAWLTSKIDPVSGFADVFPKLKTDSEIRKCIGEFTEIVYDSDRSLFRFSFNYAEISGCRYPVNKSWKIFSYGKRIISERNTITGQFESREIDLTEAFSNLFKSADIKYEAGDLRTVINSQDGAFLRQFWKLIKLMMQLRNSIPGGDRDYLISPVETENGGFYCSETCPNTLPQNADANGAYNIARKGLWILKQIKEANDLKRIKLAISNLDWLKMVQNNE